VHSWLLALVASLLVLLALLAVVGLFAFFRSIQTSTLMEDLLESWITRLSNELLQEGAWFIPTADQVPTPVVNSNAAAITAIRTRLGQGAKDAGASLRGVAFRSGLPRLTAQATVVVGNPRAFVAASHVLVAKILGDDSGYDGRVLRIVDATGAPVLAAAANLRLGAGEVWVAPQYWNDYESSATPAP